MTTESKKLPLIDSDVHNSVAADELLPFLSNYWRDVVRRSGPGIPPTVYSSPVGVLREDARPEPPLFPASGPATSSFNGLHPKSNFLAFADASDLARKASVTASSSALPAAHVIDGVTRDLKATFGRWSSDSAHRWESASLPATLALEWPAPVAIKEVHVTFDTHHFEKELVLSLSDHLTSKAAPRSPQPETVKAYRLLLDGHVISEVTDNYLRKRIHSLAFPVTGRKLELEVTATHGAPTARVYEVRAY